MRRAWWLWLVILVGCRDKAPADGALRVAVSYGSYTPGCVRVAVSDGQGHEASKDIVRSQFRPDTQQLLIAVFRKPDWGRELTVEVSSHEGGSEQEGCAGKQVEVHGSDGPISIPMKDYARLDVELRAQDVDGDRFIKKEPGVEGTDCDDGRGDVYPGAQELCSVNVDADCNGAKGCQDSACPQCTPPAGGCLTGGVCSASGECVFTPVAEGTACDDQDSCTGNDRCGATGQCAGTSVACNTPPSGCYESLGTCNSGIGCSYAFKAASTNCNDAVACTVGDACNGAGSCQGTPTPCTASSVCKKVTGGCTALGNCTEAPDSTKVNTACMIDLSRTGVCRVQDGACSTFPYAPSNFNPDAITQANIGTLTTSCTVTFDSETLLWTPASCVSNPAPPAVMMTQGSTEMVLLAMSSMSLGADLILRGTRPVILAVYGDVTLDHSILANGTIVGGPPVPGAGGNQGCTTRKGGNGTLASGAGGGGGGAGAGTAGAAGATGSVGGALPGGAGVVGGSSFVPLQGGCPGGSGAGGSVEAGKAGAGGGAVQLSVARTLTLNQWVTASGGGGGGGHTPSTNSQAGGGGGGGSGGQVLLEASTLDMAATARLTANGGGGGEGAGYLDTANQSTGEDGDDGARSSAVAAPGGSVGSFSGGAGGAGGAISKAPVSGSPGLNFGSKGGGGGGGGAVGFIRLRSLNPCSIDAAAVISPTTDKLCPL